MATEAPAAIERLYEAIHKRLTASEMSGIVGDRNHVYGYHLSWEDIAAAGELSSDYSTQFRSDQVGHTPLAVYASALDVKLPDGPGSLMTIVSHRLHRAMVLRDPRVRALREFGGTLDGVGTFAYDNDRHASEGYNTWDSSHLWHVHLSVRRKHCNDWATLQHVVDVVAGEPMTVGQRIRAFFVRVGHLPSRPREKRWERQAATRRHGGSNKTRNKEMH